MLRTRPLALLIGALFAAPSFAGPAYADLGPDYGLHLYAGLGWAYDDNLLRVPDDQPAFDNTRGDSYSMAEGGLLFDHMYSRQRLTAVAKLSKVKFNHFSQLDYDGKDVQGTWLWQLGNYLEGQLGASYSQVLAPYTDFLTDQRNLRKQRHYFFDGAWRVHPSWRARAATSRDKFTYDLAAQRFNDRTEDTFELEADYLPRTGSTVGLVARRIEGTYPHRQSIGGFQVDNDFSQDELKLRANWLATGTTTVQALVGWAKRDQPSFGGSTSGANGRITALFSPRGKFSYSASVWRDFAPIESRTVSYTLNKGASVGATWDASAKVKVDASAIYERREFNPRFAFNGSNDLRDSLRSASLRATWTLRPKIQLAAAFVHQSRSGSVALGTGSFDSNMVQLNASAQF